MPNKKTSYQRLKDKLAEYEKERVNIVQDIHAILRGKPEAQLMAKTKWSCAFDTEDMYWKGKTSS